MEDFHHICDQYNIHTIAFDDVIIDKHNWMIHASNQELTWWCKEHCYPLKLDLCVDFFLPFVKYLASTVNRITDETCLFNFVQSVERWRTDGYTYRRLWYIIESYIFLQTFNEELYMSNKEVMKMTLSNIFSQVSSGQMFIPCYAPFTYRTMNKFPPNLVPLVVCAAKTHGSDHSPLWNLYHDFHIHHVSHSYWSKQVTSKRIFEDYLDIYQRFAKNIEYMDDSSHKILFHVWHEGTLRTYDDGDHNKMNIRKQLRLFVNSGTRAEIIETDVTDRLYLLYDTFRRSVSSKRRERRKKLYMNS